MNNSIAKMSLGTRLAQNFKIMIPLLATSIVPGFFLCLADPIRSPANILAGTVIGMFFKAGLLWIKGYTYAANKLDELWENKQPIASQPVVDQPAAEAMECEAQPQAVCPSPSLPPVEDPTDERILAIVTAEPALSDTQIGQRVRISRQAANARRRKLHAMGYKVR